MKRQLLLAMTIVLTAMASMAQVLHIDGHRAPLDTISHVWLCSIPQSLFGNDFNAQVTYGDELTEVAIDGTAVASGDLFTFDSIEGGKQYIVTAYMGDSLITGNITFTWLPIVELFGNFNSDRYVYTEIFISEPDSVFPELMKAKIKHRGYATDQTRKHKRNYRIKFVADDSTKMNRRFFGLRNDNTWLLDAGQMDFLRVRNRVSTDLWLDMSRKPLYADTVANVRNGSRGQMVEVFLNGEYRGIYNMCEPIDRKQLKLVRYEPETKTFHGQIWDALISNTNVMMSQVDSTRPPRGLPTWAGFRAKYPDYNEIRRLDWTTLVDAIQFSDYSDKMTDRQMFIDSVGYYFDVPVMQDYFIFIAALQAIDNGARNIYYSCYDKAEHPRLTMTPWDLDICLGQNYSPGANDPEMIKPERDVDWISLVPMVNMWNLEIFRTPMIERYKELRKTWLNTDNLVNRYRTAIDELESCGAAAREEDRWSGDTDLAKKDLDLSAEMDYVEEWIRRHMDYLDEHVFIPLPDEPVFIPGDVNGDGEVNIADVNAVIDIILGGSADEGTMQRADVNSDGEINIADVNTIMDIILG